MIVCDYSLNEYTSRLAEQGENIILTRFPSGAKGFKAVPTAVAVAPNIRKRTLGNLWGLIAEAETKTDPCVTCLPDGARLRLANINRQFQSHFKIGASENVKFVQISADANRFRDAVEFSNGRRVRLQELPQGLQAHVLSLGGDELPTGVEISAEIDYSRPALAMAGAGDRHSDHGTGLIFGLDE
jgi:hypothetical protein